ncbi:MAG: methyltransferase domain-containing protein [Pseudomonadota bacterium]
MTSALNRHQFGTNAEKYATSAVHAKGASLAALVSAMAPEPSWQMLDLATAAGHTAFAFAPHVASVVASDLTPEMLQVAEREASVRGLANVRFVKADAQALPFEDATFDAVTCRIAPHHFPRIDRFLDEVARVLVPGGRVGVVDNLAPDTRTTPGFTGDDLEAAAEDYNLFEKLRDPSHFRALGFADWLGALDDAGFTALDHDVLAKEMRFDDWAERMNVADAVAEELLRMIEEGSTAFRAYLKPDVRSDGLWFTLAEGLFVARR